MQYKWVTPESQMFLERDYLLPGQTIDGRVNEIADVAMKTHIEMGGNVALSKKRRDKLVAYMKEGYYSFSTPIWVSFGTGRGAGISCFGSHIADTMEGILFAASEIGMMSKYGGGTSGMFSSLRGRGSEVRNNGVSSGPLGFAPLFEVMTNVVSQGKTRRGSFAGYLSVEHPDIMEWLDIRSDGNPIQQISFGVTIPEGWMQSMIDGDIQKREIQAKIIKARFETGMPFIMFEDNVSKGSVDVYREARILASNLCSEITLPSTEDESFVCCLSSMNLLHYDDWKDTDAVEILVWLLDAVMEDFIKVTKENIFMRRANLFARRHRALGVGAFGWHSYLMKNMIPFESMKAKNLSAEIFKTINHKAHAMSEKLADDLGVPEVLKGKSRRHTTMTAIAPTKSSSFIIGQASEGIEPELSNYYVKDLAKIRYTYKNPYLERVLESKGENTFENWTSIKNANGSVQHLECLTAFEKDVFKTFTEISPMEIVIQASIRQKYVDQSQSLNLRVHPDTPPRDVNALLIEAWKLGIKTLYYQYSENAAQELARNILYCSSCEG